MQFRPPTFLRVSLSLVACALAPLALSSPTIVHAQPGASSQDDPGRTMFEAGRDAYDRGRFDLALDLFERAYALSKRPKLLFNIGRAAEGDLKYPRAIEAYEGYLAANPTADNRDFVEARLAKLRELTGQPAAAPAPSTPAPAPAPAPAAPPPAPSTPSPLVSQPAPVVPPAQPYVAPSASERSGPGRFRFYGGLRLGAGGEVEVEGEDFDGTFSETTDLKPVLGVQLGFGVVWKYFGLGGELRFSRFVEEYDDGFGVYEQKYAVIDVLFKPRGGYKFAHIPLDVYATLPLGVTIPTGDMYTAGVALSIAVGASYFFTDHVGLNVETGWNLHSVQEDGDYDGYDNPDVAATYWTPLTVNFVLAL